MSVQFGRWNLDGKPVDRECLENIKPILARYGPDSSSSHAEANVSILYCAFHSTRESRHETQPHITNTGAVLTWDGRLDNRAELTSQFADRLSPDAPDVSLVSAAYEKWGAACFAKLLGAWALSIWEASSGSLTLAKDPIGTRHLYYFVDRDRVTWCTLLDPLVLLAGKDIALSEEYLAGWLSHFPAPHLTPYVSIHSVAPSCVVKVQAGKLAVHKYWEFDPGKRLSYQTDSDYEEHFRSAFGKAVQRTLRSDHSVLAELSGGKDSSSIVCMADNLLAGASAETPQLDTVSYYDDSEPNWNERPYFSSVEQRRGRIGCHIAASSVFDFRHEHGCLDASPGSLASRLSRSKSQLAKCIRSGENLVLLSGIGGDEVTGGVPAPRSELQDLLMTAQFMALARQLKLWSLTMRRPWFHLFLETVGGFFPASLVGLPRNKQPLPWLDSFFVKRNQAALGGYQTRIRLSARSASFQENLVTLAGLQRQLSCTPLATDPSYEKRYPFLDRDLLEFLFAIPRAQLLRPGQSRSLMRRALRGIVPDEILNRKRKAFVARTPLLALATAAMIEDIGKGALLGALKIINQERLAKALRAARLGLEVPIVGLSRTFVLESWLRSRRDWNIPDLSTLRPVEICADT
ncbi:MAG TPA: asparagine synthase-related protein [Terracidiphilus sp.]|jgi:asparagine synthase (glutamine-hydrolysing)